MKTEILKCLKKEKDYLSGQELCEKFAVSRTAVWKVMRQLQEEGYAVEAVRNRGYRLLESGDVFTQAELACTMKAKKAACNLVFLEQVDSTNTKAKQLAEQGAPDGTLVVAKQQTAGKGRRGKGWNSPEGSGIWMSLLLRPKFAPECASALTLVAALAVEAGIQEAAGLSCKIKWPNDIVADEKKICGILTEMSTEIEHIQYVVIGIGINVNTRIFPEELRQKATSVLLSCGKPVKRAVLVDAIMEAWERYYEKYLQTLDMSLLKEEYNRKLVSIGSKVKVLAPEGDYEGISLGINEAGELLVKLAGGDIREVVSGEVSVRGIYGYA